MKALIIAVAVLGASAAYAEDADKYGAEDLAWQELMPGVNFAMTHGDWQTGAHGRYWRFDPGVVVPNHHHTAGYRAIMLSGSMVNIMDREVRMEVGPGDYFHVAGARVHGHECGVGEPCLFYTYSDSAWDLEMDEDADE